MYIIFAGFGGADGFRKFMLKERTKLKYTGNRVTGQFWKSVIITIRRL